MAEPLEELPSYLEAGEAAAPRPSAPRVTARDVATRVGEWVGELVDGDGTLASNSSVLATGEADKDDLAVVHRVLGEPEALTAAFGRRWAGTVQIRSAFGTLRLDAPMAAAGAGGSGGAGVGVGGVGGGIVREGRLHLPLSMVPVPVRLELAPWHTVGLALGLQPLRFRSGRFGWHRRRLWFAAAHRALDQMRRALEADARRAGPA